MSRPSFADDSTKFDVRQARTSSSPALVGGNGFTREPSLRTTGTSQDQNVLPNEKGFPIQIGSELFRLSGASIMSDGQ